MKMRCVTGALMLGLLAGCINSEAKVAFDGKFFRTKVVKVDGQSDVFTVRIRDVARSLDGAREAGRHAGTSHCVEKYGNSDIDWSVGPDTPPEQLQILDDSLLFQGVCPQR